ncbi:hypothetical protein AAF712_006096 [Marasmius tenuissimus]|uniref:Asl1-like glycosyl hydrolase catalytic domain-containing protein n=1 Tax=Marasmius tenuissimus TaxID=585030 RepID=A0ABR3A0P3_9AGAR
MAFRLVSLVLFALQLLVLARNPKRGLAFPTEPGHLQDIQKADGPNATVSWMYNWDVAPAGNVPQQIEFVPMQWGIWGIEKLHDLAIGKGYRTMLAFNEPELSGQSNLSPEQAVRLWKTFVRPLNKGGVRLGSPGISSAPSGKIWLQKFFSLCGADCGVDFVAVHWYGEGIQNFMNYLHEIHATFPHHPIWITEFGCTSGSDQEVIEFLQRALDFMDSMSWVERYAWFAFDRTTTDLLDAHGNLNVLGALYLK